MLACSLRNSISLGVDRLVDGRGALAHPRPAFEPVAGVDDVGIHLRVPVAVLHLVLAVGVLLHAHEDERRQLRTLIDDLDGGTGVAAADPRIFDISDLVEVSAKRFEEAIAVFDGLVLPVDFTLVSVVVFGVLAGVERVVGHHLEGHRVSTCLPDVVDVLHPDAGLADRQWVGRRRRLAAGDEWLEIVDRSLCQEHVVPPAVGGHGIWIDAFVAVILEVREERLAHLL